MMNPPEAGRNPLVHFHARAARRLGAVCAVLTLASACQDAPPAAPGPSRSDIAEVAGGISGSDVLHRVGVLAHDSTLGRYTPSPELDKVAEWIAGEMAALGLTPGGDDGSFIQRYDVPAEGGGTAPNVVAILPGSDPEVAGEYLVYSAHMDHVGVRSRPEGGDSIFNGADDDASGTAVVMEVAEAMASLEEGPRRSVIFLLVSGEERGLWGSEAFVASPPVPVDAMVANLNADMVGRNWPDTIVAIGREHSSLGSTLEEVNRAHPEIGMTAIDDIWPDERFYYRSDHYNFARNGVPVLFFFNGTHEDYHRPSDEVELIDEDKAARIGRLLFYLGLEVADAPERPEWDPRSYDAIVDRAQER